jgi:hypothetical protein
MHNLSLLNSSEKILTFFVQSACLLLRVDDICSAKKAQPGVGTGAGGSDD